MAQSRNEIRTDLVDRTERLECIGKEMIATEDFNTFLIFAFGQTIIIIIIIIVLTYR